jgi:hypothetical protein
MDFEKIKPAVEEIVMSDEQTAHLLEICKEEKRRSTKKYWIPVAAAAAIAVLVLSPSFYVNIVGAKAESEADCAVPENGYGIIADADIYYSNEESAENLKQSSAPCETIGIYGTIPSEFSSLVSEREYGEFLSQLHLSNGMAILQFVEYFGISKEEFEAADVDGIFDSEIIFTFDRELIDEYYK